MPVEPEKRPDVEDSRKRTKKARLQPDVPLKEPEPVMTTIAETTTPIDATAVISSTPENNISNTTSETMASTSPTPKKSTPRKRASNTAGVLKKVAHPAISATNVSLEQLLGVSKSHV
jgi:hypothetical protein